MRPRIAASFTCSLWRAAAFKGLSEGCAPRFYWISVRVQAREASSGMWGEFYTLSSAGRSGAHLQDNDIECTPLKTK